MPTALERLCWGFGDGPTLTAVPTGGANILYVLLDGAQRTCELEERIAGISQKVLIEQLRALEERGIVSRQRSAGDRQGIEYLLTPLGLSRRPVLESLVEWGTHHAKELDEARLPVARTP
jgi:DNA-binding HxlR family transcriptional regulator